VKDSKLLSPERRFELEPIIKNYSLGWGIGVVEPKIIDSINIHHATLSAMKLAVEDLFTKFSKTKKTFLYIDGRFRVPGLNVEQEAVINGDYKIFSVAAASILAKTFRDRLMVQMHETFPAYNFAQHKGYPTKLHRELIQEFGLSPIHRLSFCSNLN
jgi:ribonuclease HII